MDYIQFIQSCDDLLRAGRINDVVRKLKKINSRQIDDRQRLPIARLCRRAGVASLGLKIMAPLVREALADLNYRGLEASIAEYAILLQRNGVTEEALKILKRLDPKVVPEANLYTAFCYVSRWDY